MNLAIFIVFVVAMIAVLFASHFYMKAENTVFQKTLGMITSLSNELSQCDKLVASNISTVGASNIRIATLEASLKKMSGEIEVFRDQISDTQEKQMKLREALSRKTSRIILPTGPIQMEIYPGKAANLKKVKEQLEGLSNEYPRNSSIPSDTANRKKKHV